jgi:hypothetical protein
VVQALGWHRNLPAPENAVLIGDFMLCNRGTQLAFCRQRQRFLAAHPWTSPATKVWLETRQRLEAGELALQEVEYGSRNQARNPRSRQNRYLICAVTRQLPDPLRNGVYPLRWIFNWSSSKEDRNARQCEKVLEAGEKALQRVARLVGYTTSQRIEERLEQALTKVGAREYFQYRVLDRQKNQPEALWCCKGRISSGGRAV